MKEEEVLQAKASECLRQLTSGTLINVEVEALTLLKTGISLRGSTQLRGTLTEAAERRIKGIENLAPLLGSGELDDKTKGAVSLALGEWGGEQVLEALSFNFGSASEKLRGYFIHAIAKIGGTKSVNILCNLKDQGSLRERMWILDALEELSIGESISLADGHPQFDPPRGRYPQGLPPAPGMEKIIEVVSAIYQNSNESAILRTRAQSLLWHSFV